VGKNDAGAGEKGKLTRGREKYTYIRLRRGEKKKGRSLSKKGKGRAYGLFLHKQPTTFLRSIKKIGKRGKKYLIAHCGKE